MKNGKTIFLFVCAILIIGAIFIGEINFQSMATDSGFDTGYSGGGSSSGGGSHHSSSSGGSSAPADFIDILFVACFIIGIVGFIVAIAKENYKAQKALAILSLSGFLLLILKTCLGVPTLTWKIIFGIIISSIWIYLTRKILTSLKQMEEFDKLDKFLNTAIITDEDKKLLDKGYEIYLNVQQAWMNFDYERLRKLVTDEMFNMYQSQLQTLEIKEQKNIMKKFRRKKYAILSKSKENGIITTEMIVKVSFYDYIVNSDNQIVRGTDTRKVVMTYKLTFVSNDTLIKCPNCGSKIEADNTICSYCNTKIMTPLTEMKLAKKEVLRQE